MSKIQTVDDQKEFLRLKEDGHIFTESKRDFVSELKPQSSRNTQLYRTLLHEFGHYVHYLNVVLRTEQNEEDYDSYEKRNDYYFSLPKVEKEKFAHQYANNLKKKLIDHKIIPFERID